MGETIKVRLTLQNVSDHPVQFGAAEYQGLALCSDDASERIERLGTGREYQAVGPPLL